MWRCYECIHHIAPCTEKTRTTLGLECGADARKRALIVGALYGLMSSGVAFRKHIEEFMRGLGYSPCLTDPDLWYKAATKQDGTQCYSYILCYVDGIMVMHERAMQILQSVNCFMKLKPDLIGDPDIYLGIKLKKIELDNNVFCWSSSPSKYAQEAVRNVEKRVKTEFEERFEMTKYAPTLSHLIMTLILMSQLN